MQTILITNKEEIKITDIIKINGFDNSYFNVETALGNIIIKGSNMTMDNLNTSTNELNIKGNIYNIIFSNIKEPRKSFIKRLIKWKQ